MSQSINYLLSASLVISENINLGLSKLTERYRALTLVVYFLELTKKAVNYYIAL